MDAAHAMDRMYRPQAAIYDASRKYYLLGRDVLLNGLAPAAGHNVLEIGCGTGRNLIRAARLYPRANFYGVDISEAMLAQARRSIGRAETIAPILVALGDAAAFDPHSLFGRERFEHVFIAYALSMIPRWRETIDHALTLLAPDGFLHIVDFGDCAGTPQWFRAALTRWLALFQVSPRLDMQKELAERATACALNVHHKALYRGYAFHSVIGGEALAENPLNRLR